MKKWFLLASKDDRIERDAEIIEFNPEWGTALMSTCRPIRVKVNNWISHNESSSINTMAVNPEHLELRHVEPKPTAREFLEDAAASRGTTQINEAKFITQSVARAILEATEG